MTGDVFNELEGVKFDSSDAQLKLTLDKVLDNDGAGDASGNFVVQGVNSVELEGEGWSLSDVTSDLSPDMLEQMQGNDLDTDSMSGYTFTNEEGQEVTIWSDSDQDNMSLNGGDL